MSAAGSDGAHNNMLVRTLGVWYTSWRAVSTIVFVLPVPGGPEMRNGRLP